MTLGASTSFAGRARGPPQLGALLGLCLGAAAMASLSVWCFASLVFARLLRTDTQWRPVNRTLALLLVMSIIAMWLH
jgi:threonine/homoserine/homoserine lactone efflux protein